MLGCQIDYGCHYTSIGNYNVIHLAGLWDLGSLMEGLFTTPVLLVNV